VSERSCFGNWLRFGNILVGVEFVYKKNLAILYSIVADLHHCCIWLIKQWGVDGTLMDSGSRVSSH
jgi:hypothetical protein